MRHKVLNLNIPMPTYFMIQFYFQGISYEKAQYMQLNNVFPQVQMYEDPLLLHEGKMQWLFDYKGKRYLDMFGGIATVSVGHCHPSV